jgi:ankyrin repeat domain-containing protein 50
VSTDALLIRLEVTLIWRGRFRWAYLQMEQLKKCKSWKAVLERLENLPRGLTETYDELYDRNEGSDRTYLQRAVKWVTFAYEPLPTKALLSAIQLGQNAHGMLQVDDCLEEEELENICRHFISKTSNNSWKFTHASVKEYFQDEQNERLRIWTGNTAQIDLAILSVLLFTGYKDWPDFTTHQKRKWYNETSWPSRNHSQDPQRYLRRYIGRYWISHVKDIQHLPIERSLLLQLLKPFMVIGKFPYQSSPQYQEWIQIAAAKCHVLEFDSRGQLDRYQDALPADNSIFGIVALGFFPMLEEREIEHLDLEQTNARGLSLLAIAARYGHTETCARLIDLGCKVNGIYQVSRIFNRRAFYLMRETSALLEAVSHHQANCVQLIIRKNADANLDSDTCALHKAAATADFATMETLLICGAKMNAVCQTCRFQHALELTSALN